ncbi:MAG: SGNH/GDSL hydrolase family protein [Bdellovibrionales bacterium]|nr:SGNH/GDSL hydrolase family protein [Bdellovibrionales bacterium]
MKLNLIILISSLLLTLGLSEAFVRVSEVAPKVYRLNPGARESAFKLSENPVLGYELKANYRSQNPNYHQTFPYINAHGQRDIERKIERTPGVKRVLLLGDSVVAGHGIVELDDLPNRLLEERLGSEFEVLNFGVGGYCTKAEVELLKVKGLAFKPDLVLVLFVNNDYVNRNASILHQLKNEDSVEHSALVKSLFFHSHLFRYFSIQHNFFGMGDEFKDRFLENGNAIGDNNVLEGLTELKRLSDEQGFQVVLALWPTFSSREIFYQLPTGEQVEPERVLPVEQIARDLNLKTLRMDKEFKANFKKKLAHRTSARQAQPMWIYTIGDGTHASRIGSKLMAKVLAPVVKRELSKPKTPVSEAEASER